MKKIYFYLIAQDQPIEETTVVTKEFQSMAYSFTEEDFDALSKEGLALSIKNFIERAKNGLK